MIKKTNNWQLMIEAIAKSSNIPKMEVCRRAGLGGDMARSIISAQRHVEPRHDEGEAILSQYKESCSDPVPVYERPNTLRCASCTNSYKIDIIYRTSNNNSKCINCLKRIENESRRKYAQHKSNLVEV